MTPVELAQFRYILWCAEFLNNFIYLNLQKGKENRHKNRLYTNNLLIANAPGGS